MPPDATRSAGGARPHDLAPGPPATLVIDRTHLGRRASGLERVTRELFSDEALGPLPARGAEAAAGRGAIFLAQMLRNPALALARPGSVWVFPGYPPAPLFPLFLADRTVLYVHDLFLLTRPADLNRAARLYMAPLFRLALSRLRYFLTNSLTTAEALRPHARPDAVIRPYRPPVANIFGLEPVPRPAGGADRPLVLGTVGTVEPRKNLLAAAEVRQVLAARLGRPVELHVVGRPGWGDDHRALGEQAGVRLHGFLDDAAARRVIEGFDLYLCTSHDEGLGLPLLEVQYAGLPVVAPDQPVFREVLGASGTFIDPSRPDEAARAIAALLADAGWRERGRAAALANLARWNAGAAEDRAATFDLLAALLDARRDGLPARLRPEDELPRWSQHRPAARPGLPLRPG